MSSLGDYSEFYTKLEAVGHKLKRDQDGAVDAWVLAGDYHNGPGCEVCGEAWCEHCQDDAKDIEPCIGVEAVEVRNQERHQKRIEQAKSLLESEGYTVIPKEAT